MSCVLPYSFTVLSSNMWKITMRLVASDGVVDDSKFKKFGAGQSLYYNVSENCSSYKTELY